MWHDIKDLWPALFVPAAWAFIEFVKLALFGTGFFS